jgi:hypothetical protein
MSETYPNQAVQMRDAQPSVTTNPMTGRAVPKDPRWPAIVALLAVAFLITALPSRYQTTPTWFPWTIVGIVTVAMLLVAAFPASILWRRVERTVVLSAAFISCLLGAFADAKLVTDMITHHHGYSSVTLLESATTIFVTNILIFALLYWQLDLGGPPARDAGLSGHPDFRFAQSEDDARWRPGFVDYLYVAFASSTSFQPPDHARPVSHRAKILIMLQASISLTTLFLIASRAIATLS